MDANLATLATLVTTAFAAAFAGWAAYETRQTSRAQIASALLDTYAEKEMSNDIHTLINWKKANPDNYVRHFMDNRDQKDSPAHDVDLARRRLAHYFQKAAILYHHKLIDKGLLRTVISENQVNIAEEYVKPLDLAIARTVTLVRDPEWAYRKLRELWPAKKSAQPGTTP